MYENIKSKLRAYRYCLVRIDRIRDTIAELQAKAAKVTTVYSHTPKTCSAGDSMAATVAKIADLEAELQLEQHRLADELIIVQTMIDSLDDYQERLVLELRYINGCSWQGIADKMHYTRRRVFQIHGEALKHCTKFHF